MNPNRHCNPHIAKKIFITDSVQHETSSLALRARRSLVCYVQLSFDIQNIITQFSTKYILFIL
jgi:hypothetical protein